MPVSPTSAVGRFLDSSAALFRAASPKTLRTPALLALAAVLTTGCGSKDAERPSLDAQLLQDLQTASAMQTTATTDTPMSALVDINPLDAAPRATVYRRPASAASRVAPTPRIASAASVAETASPAAAQAPQEAAIDIALAPRHITLEAGTMSSVRLSDGISNKTHKVGDLVIATLAEDVLGNDGTTLVPRGMPVVMRIRQISSSENSRSGSPVIFELVQMRIQGQTVNVRGTGSVYGENTGRGWTAGQVGKVAATTGAGAVIGSKVGGRTGGLIGGVIGALGGKVIADRTADQDIMVSPDAEIQIQFTDGFDIVVRPARASVSPELMR